MAWLRLHRSHAHVGSTERSTRLGEGSASPGPTWAPLMTVHSPSAGELFLLATVTGVMLALGSSVGSTLGRQLAQPTEMLARLASRASQRRGQQRRA